MRKQSPSLHPSQSLHPKVQHQGQELQVMVGVSIFEIKEFKLRKHQKQKPICTLCKQAFASWTDLPAHWKKKHGGQDEYKCDKVTHSLASHKKHILLHEEDKKKLKCFVCGHKFNFKSELDRHNVVHLSDRKHICPTRGCGKSLKCKAH